MEGFQINDTALFEHQFWLQIMGDHSRFIFFSLVPTESEFLITSQEFVIKFDQLLELSHNQLTPTELTDLHRQAYDLTYRLREFKLQLLAMTLNSELKAHISSSFFNDMVNELDEYLYIINMMMKENIPVFHPIHYHLLWLTNAVGHAAMISSELDFIERDMIDKSYQFETLFNDLNMKAIRMNGYLRTQLNSFPSLKRLNEQAGLAVSNFREFLETIRDQRMDGRILGTLFPLMADHMAREECYYLWKLSQVTQNIRRPDCIPTQPRVET